MADEITTVATGQLGAISNIANSAMGLVMIVFAVIILVAVVVGLTLMFIRVRKFKQFRCVIWEKDGFGQLTQTHDEAAIFVDGSTGNKRFFLRFNNVGLEPDNVPYLTSAKGNKVVYLLKTGLKNFKFIKPIINDDLITFTVGEEDVNWAVNAYEAQKKRFQTGWLMQYLPFIVLAFSFMIFLIMFVYIFNKLPLILDITKSMKEVAVLLAQARTGTTILPAAP